jgi:para-aminobenzoate synthetase/4-amino-4-deoxychorismate lyase
VPYDAARVRQRLMDALEEIGGAARVRLLLDQDGGVRVEHSALVVSGRAVRVVLAEQPVDTTSPFLFHKTTRRDAYDAARVAGFDDTILWNPRGEVTEATTANVVVDVGGRKVTPPVACGLLAGTYRDALLETGDIVEGVVTCDALRAAPRLWLINSVQGWREGTLDVPEGRPESR